MISLRWDKRPKDVRSRLLKHASMLALLDSNINSELVEVSIYFTDDETIATLNEKFRGEKGPTDILSFPYNPPVRSSPRKPYFIGEIIISIPTAKRQAKECNRSLEDEIGFLVIHGVLHIGGYEDETEEGYNFMISKGEKIWSEVKEAYYNHLDSLSRGSKKPYGKEKTSEFRFH